MLALASEPYYTLQLVDCKVYYNLAHKPTNSVKSASIPLGYSVMSEARIIRVVVASPGDVDAERKALPKIIEDVNQAVGIDRNLRLELSTWEKYSYPGFHVRWAARVD